MRKAVIGILAHVDAGKTTLSEALLYLSGTLRTLGRVDHGDTFLDNFALERERGITIFSKQAVFAAGDLSITLLDTPGHVDFSAETERTLDVLDAAVLVVSGSEGVQSHTRTLWRLLRRRNIPTIVFINKTDLPGADAHNVMRGLISAFGDGFYDYASPDYEEMATADEHLLDEYLRTGSISKESVKRGIAGGKLFPCFFGAALKLSGVEEFFTALPDCIPEKKYGDGFAAKVFKVARDDSGARLTYIKVTGGVLSPRDTVNYLGLSEKVTQIRIYSGAKFTQADKAEPGDVAAVLGLTSTRPGMGLGAESDSPDPVLEPVLTYDVILPEGCDVPRAVSDMMKLREEEPELRITWDERLQKMRAQLMGTVQLEVIKELVKTRYGLDISFGHGAIIYRETIKNTVEGVGHFEPLRHYAEVHLLLEPGERGSGLRFRTDVPTDDLSLNWQRLILTHLFEKQHRGVLTGAPITDMRITLVAARAHEKHTEGGDFREATYRAVRQGLMMAESVLLEPWYDFYLELPTENLGRAINDLQRMGADFELPGGDGENSVITGCAPVSLMREYPEEVAAYTHGEGKISLDLGGYRECPDQDRVVAESGYDPEADIENTPDSVFCTHGAGYLVKWYDVPLEMHLESVFSPEPKRETLEEAAARYTKTVATDAELMKIFERTYGPVKDRIRDMRPPAKKPAASKPWKAKPQPDVTEYTLVDGYNIIFAWDELRDIAKDNLDAARERLIERLRNYQGFRRQPVILVFDAYKVIGGRGSLEKYGDFSVVYTKEAETADMYIEKATYDLGKKHRVRVATSDALEQVIILAHGALRIPASAFEAEVKETEAVIRGYINA